MAVAADLLDSNPVPPRSHFYEVINCLRALPTRRCEFLQGSQDEIARTETPLSAAIALARPSHCFGTPSPCDFASVPHLSVPASAFRDPLAHEPTVTLTCDPWGRCELAENEGRVLPWHAPGAHQRTMTSPFIAVQDSQVRHQSSADRVQMNVANELEEVWLFLDDDRLEAVLEKMAGAAVAAIESHGIPG